MNQTSIWIIDKRLKGLLKMYINARNLWITYFSIFYNTVLNIRPDNQ